MEWLTPMTALYAGAAAVPLLLLMYFLKLKRVEQIVSSTLLWKRAVQDLQVNAPFQKIRRNLLFLLQLLLLLAILLALSGPVLLMTAGPARRYVLLIDRSASMNTIDVETNRPQKQQSRLDAAKKQAKVFIESLRNKAIFSLQDESDQAMVIACDNRARIMCNFTSDKRQLLSAIEAVTPSDGGTSVSEAVMVARAFAKSPGEETNNRSARNPAQLVLFSDGQIQDVDQIALGPDEMIFNCIGKSTENIAIIAMQARRSFENPDELNVFTTLANYDTKKTTCDIQLSINDDVQAIKTVTVPPRKTQNNSADQPGKVAVTFTLTYERDGVLEVRQLQPDCLTCDDAAWTILSPPKKLSVLLVSAGNIVLETALKACPLARLEIRSPAEFDAMDHSAMSVEQPYDVIVLDNYVSGQLPRCSYLVFGRPPAGIDVSVAQQLENQVVIDWRSRHPILKYVNLINLFAAKCNKMILPRDADVLAEFNESPALALVRRGGNVYLLAGFDVLQTNWPFESGFVLFCYNATNFLGTQSGAGQLTDLQVGQPLIVEGLPGGIMAQISGPGLSDKTIKANSAGVIRFPGTNRVGIYSLEIPDQPIRLFSVNLLADRESNIEPVREITLSGQTLEARADSITKTNIPAWPYLVLLALLLACLEWLIYNSKIRIR